MPQLNRASPKLDSPLKALWNAHLPSHRRRENPQPHQPRRRSHRPSLCPRTWKKPRYRPAPWPRRNRLPGRKGKQSVGRRALQTRFGCLQLRVQDLNFATRVLTVHDGKGQKDRTAPLPEALVPELQAQLERVAQGHEDVRTTMIYTHTVRSITLKEAKSPLDF